MEKIYVDPNVENENTEHIRGKRLSSILKAPRNPLDDLGNGNELTQDNNIEKRRKNSRRVSFANTIDCRVFQRDLKSSAAERESTGCGADTRNDVLLNQNEDPEAVPCEITGMNTLLHAPIQAAVQQTEWQDVHNATQRTNRHDTTLIFLDENEMDMTASHTAVISRNQDSSQADNTEKIDITSFLTGLNSNSGKAEMGKEFPFFSDHPRPSLEQKKDATTVRKIDFNEFLMSLNSNEKAPNPAEGPEKENMFFVPSAVAEDVARSSAQFVYSHEPLDTCNVTKVFKGHDDGMEMTKCQASDVKAVFSDVCDALPEQFLRADVTEAFVDDGMDMTVSHTAKVSFPFTSVGNQSLNFQKNFPSAELDKSILKKAPNQLLTVRQGPQLCTDKKAVAVEDRQDLTSVWTVKPEARAMSAIPGSVCSETVFRGDKAVVLSMCNAMEITGNCIDIIHNDRTKEMSVSCPKPSEKPVNTHSLLAENRHPALGDGDITRSLMSLDNRGSVSYGNSALEAPSGSDERMERVTQEHRAAPVNAGFDSCTDVPKSRAQHRAASSHLLSLPGEKTLMFSGEDMDLTKTWVVKDDGKDAENESPAGVLVSVTCKSHFLDNRATSHTLNEQEEMEITKCHAIVIDDQSNGMAAKQMHCNTVPRKNQSKDVSEDANSLDMDKENLEVIGINGNIKSNQAEGLEMMMVDKKLGKTNFQASDSSSSAKSLCPLQEQKRDVPESAVTVTRSFVSLQNQNAVVSQLLGENLPNASASCTNDGTDRFAGDENMDITRTHPAAFDVAPVEKYESKDQNKVIPKQLQIQTSWLPGSSGVDITSQSTAIECGDLKVSTKQQTVPPGAPSGSLLPSNDPAPSGMKGKEQLGISADWQSSERQERTHTVKAVHKVLPPHSGSERDFSVGRTVSSAEGLQDPCSVAGLRSRGAQEPLAANPSEPRKGSSQLPLFLEKSVVFPSGENMDLTESCGVVVPDHNINPLLLERKAVPAYLVQGDNKTMPLKTEVAITMSSREQPVCDASSLVSGKKMSGLKHSPFADEQTVVFPADADMDITRSHTVSADNKIILQQRGSSSDVALESGDKTCVFTHNNDMEISAVALDKPAEKAAAQGMLNIAKRTRRKSLMRAAGERTVLFSLSDENNDMEITESHTAAIGHEMALQNEDGLHSVPSAHPVKAVTFPSPQDDMDITQPCSTGRIAVQVLCGDKPDNEAGQQALPESEATVFALDDMEITKTHNAAPEGNSLRGGQPNQRIPFTSTVLFTSYQANMEMTECPSVDESGEVFHEGGLNQVEQVGQKARSDSRTIDFPLAEDMELTKTHTAALSGKMDVQDRGATPAILADRTIVFTHNQDDMEITASHTTALNNNVNGFENREDSHQSIQQLDAPSASSSCSKETGFLHPKDLNGEHCTESKDKPSIPSSASSASALPSEKGAVEVHSGATVHPVYSVPLLEEMMDVQAPQDLHPPMDDSVPGSSQQDLVPPENLKPERVSFKLLSNELMDCSEQGGDVESHVSLAIQHLDPLAGSPDAHTAQRNQGLKEDASGHGDLATCGGVAGASFGPVPNEGSKETAGLSATAETPPGDLQINSEQSKQRSGGDSPRDEMHPALAPELSGILNVCSKLKNMRRKSVVLSVSETALSDGVSSASTRPGDPLRWGTNTTSEPNNVFYPKEQEDASLESRAAPVEANVGVTLKDKYQGLYVPLGIFQPKLPSRRPASVSGVQDTCAKASDKSEAAVSEVSVDAAETPGNKKPGQQNFSPSQFIVDEFLPICLEEMDSNESVSSEFMENTCNKISKPHISHNEKNQLEETKACKDTKRALEQEDEEEVQSPKKLKRDENLDGKTPQDLQVAFDAVSQSRVEVCEGEDPPNLSTKSPDSAHASTSSSLDSVKVDTELTIQRSSQFESQLLTDSICEDTLREKFQSGVITVGEFFTLLQVHVPIQKPRHSHVPASGGLSAPPTPEDLIYSQYIYRPKLRIYEEDCQALSQKIEELKEYTTIHDQLLVNVNRGLWEVMRTCSDEELKSFGAELNKMKSYFTKESKILAHNEKATLYSKLLQSAQEQHEKLQARMKKLDELIEEAESCLAALESDSDDWEADCSDGVAEGKNLKKELKILEAEEEELQRELLELETQNEQMLAEMDQLREKEKRYRDLVESYDFTEWEIAEWSEQQAVFTFLYDSIGLTVVFGPSIDGDASGEDPSRKIVSLSFESLLDEEEAPPSSCLVQRLIFQFIESQGCWQEKCPTLQYLPQVLHDVSLVVSHCRTLGEEIEFLERWGGKFNLLKMDIDDTKVKLLFSASAVFMKFEVMLSLSANYPSASLPFAVQKRIGNIGEEEISAVLSDVPIGHHYLRRIVSSIHQNLLRDPR
ncbi:kinetochore scaffold 1 [Phaenicophaeus curvirostris]|uniref:kinetochore scaffold 1 n=1 Tax=Phaenicophaeus curvirostris TaxID=33595 RepID=UPI0037F0BC95